MQNRENIAQSLMLIKTNLKLYSQDKKSQAETFLTNQLMNL